MKTFVFILFAAILAAGLFIAGLRIGYHQRLVSGEYAIPMLDKQLADATSKAVILHLMDLGQYSDARAIIQGQFNYEMLQLALDSNGWDIQRLDSARRACARIVAFRNAYPSNYVSHPALGDTWTVDQINNYLKKLAQSETNQVPTPIAH